MRFLLADRPLGPISFFKQFSRLLKIALLSCAEAWHDFNAAEAWVVVRSYCRVAIVAFDCGSALWADFFFKQSSWLLKIGLLLFAEEWHNFKAAGHWIAFC